MNARAKKEHIFTFNMEWLDVNSSNVGETRMSMSRAAENGNTLLQWRKKTPIERLRECKWVPPRLAERCVTEEEFDRLCDILISTIQILPFQSCGRQGCINPGWVEILYFCFPLGPLCCCLQMMNPITCMLYWPFEMDIQNRVLPAMNDILRRCNLKAIKSSSFTRNIAIVENFWARKRGRDRGRRRIAASGAAQICIAHVQQWFIIVLKLKTCNPW